MNVSLEYYRIFYYVAKYQNFTKAAHALGSSQPNVTRSMNLLEQEVGCTLFIRTNRGVRLTPEGEKLYTRVSAAMTQFSAAEEELQFSTGLEHGSIAIGATETALNIYLLDRLRDFHMAYPGIRLRIFNHSTPQAIQAMDHGEVDFSVITTPADVPPHLHTTELGTFRDILIGGKTFTALASQELSLGELKNYPLICLGRETMSFRFFRQLFAAHHLEFAADTEAATTDQILPMVQHDLGLAFLPETMAQEALQHHSIVQIPLREEVPQRTILLVHDRQRPLSAAARMLKQVIQNCQQYKNVPLPH